MRHLLSLAIVMMPLSAEAQGFLWSPLRESTMTCDFCGYRSRSSSCHGGVDFRARRPLQVYAASDGRVEFVVERFQDRPDNRLGYANHVILVHPNGFRTLYGHLTQDSVLVDEGQEVTVGQQLALTDNSGASSAPHLHFEVRDPSGRRVDPYGTGRDNTRCLTTIDPVCGTNPLWVVCPPQPWDSRLADRDGDGYCGSASGCAGTLRPGDCDDANAAIHPGVPEVCDGVDNNCVSGIDETFRDIGAASLGNACTVGLGACVRTGTMVCTADHRATVCSADPGSPTPEICDNLNNDCDCEGADCRCGAPTVSCLCLGSRCTELTDENFRDIGPASLGNSCTVGSGTCINTGAMVCAADGRATVCGADPPECPGERDCSLLSYCPAGFTCANPCDGIRCSSYCRPSGSACTDECPIFGSYRCSPRWSGHYNVCVSGMDGDPCLEWGADERCSTSWCDDYYFVQPFSPCR